MTFGDAEDVVGEVGACRSPHLPLTPHFPIRNTQGRFPRRIIQSVAHEWGKWYGGFSERTLDLDDFWGWGPRDWASPLWFEQAEVYFRGNGYGCCADSRCVW